jgi:hypothetical protein
MKKLFLAILATSLTFTTLGLQFNSINAQAVTTTLISENFSSGSLGTNFNLLSGSIDLVGPNTQFVDYPSAVDLNGGSAGSIESQNFPVLAGDVVTLTFGLDGNFAGACNLNYEQKNDNGESKEFIIDESDRTASVTFGGVTQKINSSTPGMLINVSFEFPITESGTSKLTFASTKLGGDTRCGVLITDIVLTKISPEPSGGSITITASNTQSSVSVSSQSESIISSSSATSSQSENKGVLGFTTTAQEQGSSSKATIDPTKTTILVSSELKSLIDSAKGGTTRTGGSDN